MNIEKEHIFNSIPSESDIKKALFLNDPENDPNDPRCINYKRKHTIPKINWLNVANVIICSIFLACCLGLVLHYYFSNIFISIFVPIGIAFIIGIICIKKIAIFIVELYQKFAPLKVRDKCRFYPSCSDYMKLSIIKYGFYKGFIKGCKRIKRCKYPNGGYDYP